MEKEKVKEITIIIPEKIPSANGLYPTNRMGFRYLPREGKEFKERIGNICNQELLNLGDTKPDFTDKKLVVKMWVSENWFNKDGTIKKKDLMNKEKFVIDSVFKGLNLDDSQIFVFLSRKITGSSDKTKIVLSELN
ncbi:MAG: RusA family crossover junction endodeoxyribonuclease [Nitrososphaerales archaeon]